jgi:PAS domain S-box-containing protein
MTESLEEKLKKLQFENSLLQTMFDSSPEAMMLLSPDSDSDYRIIRANNATLELLGYHLDEFIGLKPFEFSAEPEKTKKALAQLANNGEGVIQRVMRRKDGSIFFSEIYASVINVNDQNYIFAQVRDISDLKSIEMELNERVKELNGLYNLSMLLNQEISLTWANI